MEAWSINSLQRVFSRMVSWQKELWANVKTYQATPLPLPRRLFADSSASRSGRVFRGFSAECPASAFRRNRIKALEFFRRHLVGKLVKTQRIRMIIDGSCIRWAMSEKRLHDITNIRAHHHLFAFKI